MSIIFYSLLTTHHSPIISRPYPKTMPHLFGKDYSREELQPLVSTMAQLAGVRLYELSDGKARGMRVAEVYTGSGFRFQVFLDRAMDIGAAEYSGTPLAWLHPALGGPDLYEPEGYGWARTFGGGLLTTCGLTHFGQPQDDGGKHYGLHGRIAHIPATQIKVTEEWRDGDYVLELEGQVRQSALGEENLLLIRKISTKLGAYTVTVEDVVSNEGFRETPHMILYHCNFGFPIVSESSELLVSDEFVNPRDDAAREGLSTHRALSAPANDYAEQVFFHKPRMDADGYTQIAIANSAIGIGAYLRYRAIELPYLAQWKLMRAGEYVCALEPANHWEARRERLRQEGRLVHLASGAEVHYRVELGVLAGSEAINEFRANLPGT